MEVHVHSLVIVPLTHQLIICLIQSPPDWQDILVYFRGSELQNYFTKILEDDLKVTSASF